jgi:hypothetical protein
MTPSFVRRAVQVATFVMVFAGGYVLGTLDVQPAETQVGDLGTNVSNLQKNIDALNKIKAALGG